MRNTTKTKPEHAAMAQQLWNAFDQNERTGVRFGMFPHAPLKAAEAEGYDLHTLTVALMDVASQNGGMRA